MGINKISFLILGLLAAICFAYVNEGDQCKSIGVTDDTCIMCSGTPCMNSVYNESICKGEPYQYYDQVIWMNWMGGSDPCECYCPYSLYQDAMQIEAQQADKCKGVTCDSYCDGGVYKYGGTCDASTGGCSYSSNNCGYGCDADGCKAAPPAVQADSTCTQSGDKMKAYCKGYCDIQTLETDCEVAAVSGETKASGIINTCTCFCGGDYSYGHTYRFIDCSKPLSPAAIPPKADEICNNKIDDNEDGLVDCADPQCASDPVCQQEVQIKLIEDSTGSALKYMKVTLYAAGSNGAYSAIGTDYTGADGMVKFKVDMTQYQEPATAYAQIQFQDKDGVFDMYYGDGTNNIPIVIESTAFQIPWQGPVELQLYENANWVDKTKTNSGISYYLNDLGYIYYNFIRILDFYRTDIGYGFKAGGLPVKVYTFDSEPNACEACYRPSERKIIFNPGASLITDASAPENREWHEFTHHAMYDLYSGGYTARVGSDANHAGFKNSVSSDSLNEAFAEFWPAILGKDNIYGGFHNMDDGTKSWNSAGKKEELAVLNAMWDLREYAFGDYKTEWGFFASKQPRNVKELYDAVSAQYPGRKGVIDAIFVEHGLFVSKTEGNNKYDLGEPFWDKDNNKKWDSGEVFVDLGTPSWAKVPMQIYDSSKDAVGTASNYERPTRNRRPYFEENFVKLDVADSGGKAITDAAFKITYEYSGTCNSTGFSQQGYVDNGMIYLLYPSDDLDTCDITAVITPENYQNAGELRIPFSEFFAASNSPASPQYAMEKSIKVGSAVEFCNNDGKCDYGESGSCADCHYAGGREYECFINSDCGSGGVCESGACTTGAGNLPQAGGKPVKIDNVDGNGSCISIAIVLGALAGAAWIRRKQK